MRNKFYFIDQVIIDQVANQIDKKIMKFQYNIMIFNNNIYETKL